MFRMKIHKNNQCNTCNHNISDYLCVSVYDFATVYDFANGHCYEYVCISEKFKLCVCVCVYLPHRKSASTGGLV